MIRVYSHSQLEAFEDCPKRYAYRYVWRQESRKARGVEGFMGNLVHSTIERTFHHFAHHGTIATLTTLLDSYRREWDFQRPERGLYVAKRDREELDYLKDGRRALANFHGKATRGEFAMSPISVERPLDFVVAGRQFTGVVDYLAKDAQNRLIVLDWKTGKPKDTSNDRQLPLYEIGLRQTYDDAAPYVLVHEFLTFGVTRRREAAADSLREVEERAGRVCASIEAADTAGGPWPARPSGLCGWCDFSDVCEESRAK